VQLQQELTQALQRNRAAIEAILREYGVPLVGDATSASEPGAYSSALPR
jgi:hypothetical protein